MADNIIIYAPASGSTIVTKDYLGTNVHLPINALGGRASTNNLRTTALGASATYTGTWERTEENDAMITWLTDAAGTLYVDFSMDGVTTHSTITYKVVANSHGFHTIVKGFRYFRVRLVNGSVAQTTLSLAVYFGQFRQGTSALNSTIAQDADASVTRSLNEELLMGEGKMAGYNTVNKSGKNTDIDIGTVPEDLWEGGGSYTGWATGAETLQVFSSSANDAAAGTGARTVRITGLDANYNVQSETVTLNGVTPVVTVNSFLRAHTMRVVTAGSGGVNAGDITVRQSTTTANVMLFMLAGINQTNTVSYTVPAGKTAYIKRFRAQVLANTSGAVNGAVYIREFGEVFRQRRPFTASNTSYYEENIYGSLRVPEKSDITMRITYASANNLLVTGGYDIILVDN